MIKQTATGLSNLTDANPYLENGCLPLITAPNRSVVNEDNYLMLLENKIQVCLPAAMQYFSSDFGGADFVAISLTNFENLFIKNTEVFVVANRVKKVCIETPTDNSPELFEVIRKAKEIHGDTLMIMAGNVGSVKAFVELAKAGCDYIRVGINEEVTKNTGVGVKDLAKLVKKCAEIVKYCRVYEEIGQIKSEWFYDYQDSLGFHSQESADNLKKVKIVADNIYPYIKQCELKYGFNINGYAAINKLLFSGADLVMLDAYVPRLGLEEWLNGSANSNNYPYLTGWIDSLKEAMAYTNKSKL